MQNTEPMTAEDLEAIRATDSELFPDEVAAGVSREEIAHCSNVVGELADEQGLVVITAEVVKMLIRERAAARVQGITIAHNALRAGDHRAGRRLERGQRVRIHPGPEHSRTGIVSKADPSGTVLVNTGEYIEFIAAERLEPIP